jgi:hypothetical protein
MAFAPLLLGLGHALNFNAKALWHRLMARTAALLRRAPRTPRVSLRCMSWSQARQRSSLADGRRRSCRADRFPCSALHFD